MNCNYADYQARSNFALLDGIRAVAILAVVWHHSAGNNPFDNSIFSRGYLGVDLFFVLSGFLITTLLLREKRRVGFISLKKFYIRRTLRIFPIYYAYLLAMFLWIWFRKPHELDSYLEYLPYYVFYVTNWIPHETEHFFGIAWSLAVEEQFYLVWPAILVLFGIRSATKIALLLIVLFSVIVVFVSIGLIPFRTLLFGVMLAFVLDNQSGYQSIVRVFSSRHSMMIVVVLIAALLLTINGPIIGVPRVVVHMLFVCLIGCAVVNEHNTLRPLFANRCVQIIGMVSYGIYVLHGQLYGLTQKLCGLFPIESISESRLLFFFIYTFISTCVAVVSYYFFEIHFLKLKDRFINIASPKISQKPA